MERGTSIADELEEGGGSRPWWLEGRKEEEGGGKVEADSEQTAGEASAEPIFFSRRIFPFEQTTAQDIRVPRPRLGPREVIDLEDLRG